MGVVGSGDGCISCWFLQLLEKVVLRRQNNPWSHTKESISAKGKLSAFLEPPPRAPFSRAESNPVPPPDLTSEQSPRGTCRQRSLTLAALGSHLGSHKKILCEPQPGSIKLECLGVSWEIQSLSRWFLAAATIKGLRAGECADSESVLCSPICSAHPCLLSWLCRFQELPQGPLVWFQGPRHAETGAGLHWLASQGVLVVKNCQRKRLKRHRFNLWVKKIPWRRKWQHTWVFLPGESHGQRSLVGYSS